GKAPLLKEAFHHSISWLNEHFSVRLGQFFRDTQHRFFKRYDRRHVSCPAPIGKTLLRFYCSRGAAFGSNAAHPLRQPEAFDPLVHEDHLSGLRDDRLRRVETAIDNPSGTLAHCTENCPRQWAGYGIQKDTRLLDLQHLGQPLLEVRGLRIEHMGSSHPFKQSNLIVTTNDCNRAITLVFRDADDQLAKLARPSGQDEGFFALILDEAEHGNCRQWIDDHCSRIHVAHRIEKRYACRRLGDCILGPAAPIREPRRKCDPLANQTFSIRPGGNNLSDALEPGWSAQRAWLAIHSLDEHDIRRVNRRQCDLDQDLATLRARHLDRTCFHIRRHSFQHSSRRNLRIAIIPQQQRFHGGRYRHDGSFLSPEQAKRQALSDLLLSIFLQFFTGDLTAVHRVRSIGKPQGPQICPGPRQRRILADALRAIHLDRFISDLQRHARRHHLDLADP